MFQNAGSNTSSGGGRTDAADGAGGVGDPAAVVVLDPVHEGGLGGAQDRLVQEDDVQQPRHAGESGAAQRHSELDLLAELLSPGRW